MEGTQQWDNVGDHGMDSAGILYQMQMYDGVLGNFLHEPTAVTLSRDSTNQQILIFWSLVSNKSR